MSLLIDAHVLLWWLNDDKRLGDAARTLISTQETDFISIASLWDVIIKRRLGKLEVDVDVLFDTIPKQGFSSLPIAHRHLLTLDGLPMHHRDPFDRMIIAQAMTDKCTVLTGDQAFYVYDIDHIDARQ